MTAALQSATAKAGVGANNPPSGADVGFDVFRLDCAVDALRGQDISQHRQELARVAANLLDLLEPLQ